MAYCARLGQSTAPLRPWVEPVNPGVLLGCEFTRSEMLRRNERSSHQATFTISATRTGTPTFQKSQRFAEEWDGSRFGNRLSKRLDYGKIGRAHV